MKTERVVKNAMWIICVKIAKSIIVLVISALTARFLGPSNYGLINYASSIVAFVAPIMYLGFSGTLVQEIVTRPSDEGRILGTAITLSLISSLFCVAGVVGFVSIANAGERETLIVCFLYSLLLIFQSIDLVQYWFQAKLLSKSSSIASLIAYIIVAVYKIFLLATGKNIYWFAIANVLEYFIIAFLLILVYNKKGGQRFRFSFSLAKEMFNRSKYFIISDLMITVFAQTDRIMLKLMISDEVTGYYSAAVTCAGIGSFVYGAIIESMRPMVFENKQGDKKKYEQSVICLFSMVIYLSLLQSIVFTIGAPLIVKLLYGDDYSASVGVLQIIVWYCTFSYLGGARSVWILAEGKQKHTVVINLFGAVLNVGLNLLLIPKLEASGAAIATVITQLLANVVFTSIYKPTRRYGYLLFNALNPKYVVHCIKQVTVFRKKKTAENLGGEKIENKGNVGNEENNASGESTNNEKN